MIEKLKKFLKEKGIDYKTIKHDEAFTAQEIAAVTHVPGKESVKVVIVNGDDKYFMAVLPASYRIDTEKLKKILNVKKLKLSTEEEFENLFPGCETGAMPPFGNLYDLPVYIDSALTEDETIVFLAGDHKESIKMKYKDYDGAVKPVAGGFAVKLN